MKFVVSFLLVALLGVSVYCRPKEEYTSKYDNINIDEILKSDRLINSYFKCLMTGESCTPDGAELRRVLPDAIETDCVKCSEKHQAGGRKIFRYLIDNKPDLWKQLESKYDPEGKYKKRYKEQHTAELEKAGLLDKL